MSSVLDDINKRRTRQSVGEQPAAAPVEPVASAAQPMGDQASARVYQGENGNVKTENGLNPTAEQKATAMALMNPAAPGYTIPQQAVAPVATTPTQSAAPKQMTYTDLHKELYKPMTPEEKEAQQKRQRNRQIINAVGDGISALANLYYTNRSGVNAYDPSTSLTKAAKERYDKLLAQQREDEERYKELAYRSGAADLEMAYRRERDAEARRLAQENWQKTFDYNKAKDAADRQERDEARAEENKTKKYIADLNAETRKELSDDKKKAIALKSAKSLYGKSTVHGVDGYPIYDRAWNGGWPEVFNALVNNNAGIKENESEPTYRRRMGEMTDKAKQEFVDGYYKDYPEAVALMARMAADTPERHVDSIIADSDDYSQYAVGGDEYSQYIIE